MGYYIVSPFGKEYKSSFGVDCVNWFVDQMLELQQTRGEYFTTNQQIQITPEEEQFRQNSKCWLCEKPVQDKVGDHDHLTCKYRGAACNKRNLNCEQKVQTSSLYFSTTSVGMIVI